MIKRLAVTALFLLACGAQQAAAQYCTGYASTLSFGSYNPTTPVSVTGTVTVTCSSGFAYHVGLNAGAGSGGTTTTRIMNSGSHLMSYEMFQDAARTINWGNTPPSNTVNGTGTGSPRALTVYALLPAGQYVNPGSYTDTITVTITSSLSPTTFQFGVNATALSTCAVSATAMNFGTYSGALINITSTVTVTCNNSTTYNVGLNAGLGSGATVTNRKMTSPASATLKYAIFRNSTWTQNWGNTVGTDTVAGTGNGTAVAITAYGQMAAGQSGNPAVYSDTITATITY